MSAASSKAFNNPQRNKDVLAVPWGPVASLLTFFSTELLTFGTLGILASFIGGESLMQLVILYSVAGLISLFGAVVLLRTYHFSWRKFFRRPVKGWLYAIPLYFIQYMFFSNILSRIADQFPSYNSSQAQDFGFSSVSGWGLVGVFFVLVIIPPITEEILFRGVLYRGLRGKWGRIASALVVSMLFGVLHGQWNVGLDTFVLSLLLILSLEQTKSLFAPMGIHMLKNLLAFVALFVFHL